jgi:hypothetical protein
MSARQQTSSASSWRSCPPFSKSSGRVAIAFVTCAMQVTGLRSAWPIANSAAASISAEMIPSDRRLSMSAALSRNGASVVQDAPRSSGVGMPSRARATAFASAASASAKRAGGT